MDRGRAGTVKILQELRAELVEREKLLRAKLEGIELALKILGEEHAANKRSSGARNLSASPSPSV